jgi:hypothetical protein
MGAAVPELKTVAELADQITGEAKDTPEEAVDPRDSPTFTFDFVYTDPRGKQWSGRFTNRILTNGMRRQQKVVKAHLAGGASIMTLDTDQWQMNEMAAHLAISLDQKADGFPSWAKNLDSLHDDGIVAALYKEVDGHEARFRRRDAVAAQGEGTDAVGTG